MPRKLSNLRLHLAVLCPAFVACAVVSAHAWETEPDPTKCPSAVPELVRVVPAEGTAGTLVAVEGHGFAGEVHVWLGDTDLGVLDTVSPELVVIEVPELLSCDEYEYDCAHALLDIEIRNVPGQERCVKAGAFKYWHTCPNEGWPEIEFVEPDAGAAGTAVTIYGNNFGRDMLVFFGWMPAWPVEFVSDGELRVEVPPLPPYLAIIELYPPPPIPVDVTVVNIENGLWDRLRDGFTYEWEQHGLRVDDVVPDSGPPGIEATVFVSGFSEEVTVYFGAREAPVIDRPSLDEIVVEVPPFGPIWPGPVDSVAYKAGSQLGCDEDDPDEPPIDDRYPGCWPTVPVTVMDTGSGVWATKPAAFTYIVEPRPAVVEVDPAEGPPGILAAVTVRGFSEAVSVYFGRCMAPVVDRPSLDEIVVEVPPCPPAMPLPADECVYKSTGLSCDDENNDDAGDPGNPDGPFCRPTVPVTVVDLETGRRATKWDAFTYVFDPEPAITSVDPDKGHAGMLTTLTVLGFGEAVRVYFGVCAAPVVQRPSLDEIVVEVPPCTPPDMPWAEISCVDGGSVAELGNVWCDRGGVGPRQSCTGDSSWHRVCVTVVDVDTGACAVAPHAFTYIHGLAVGLLAVSSIEIEPGTTVVEIPILLDYHGTTDGAVSTLLFALAYDHEMVAITDVLPGDAAIEAGKRIYWNIDENGLLRVAVTDGIDEIPQGELCVLRAEISAGAAYGRASRLRFDELSAASPGGTELELEGLNGTVRVGMSYDVNEDWTVDAIDVQRVINIALHVVTGEPAMIMKADGDADGDVDAVDIQRAVNKALSLEL